MNILLSRFCFKCKKEIFYKNTQSYKCSIRRYKDVICKRCSNKEHSFWKGKTGKDASRFEDKCSEKTKKLLSEKLRGNKKIDIPILIIRFNKIHENKYDYSKINYVNNHTKIKIICPEHGEFLQIPSSHLNGNGCPFCKYKKLSIKFKSNNEEFINKSNKIHNFIYNYSKINYINNRVKVKIVCPKHGLFWQTPNAHIFQKQGCPKCNKIVSKKEIEFLNYLKIPDTKENRQKYIKPYKVDGYDLKTNTIYEFLGDYFHGNPKKYNPSDYNKICHKTFGELYENTFNKLKTLKNLGYNIKYIWESDWSIFKNNNLLTINEY